MANRKLLYCDDDEYQCGVHQRFFSRRGIDSDIAFSCDEAAEKMRMNSYDVVMVHFSTFCTNTFRKMYERQMGMLSAFRDTENFRDEYHEFDPDLVSSGGFFLVYLHVIGYCGLRILTTGQGDYIEVFIEKELVHRIFFKPYPMQDLERVLNEYFRIKQDI